LELDKDFYLGFLCDSSVNKKIQRNVREEEETKKELKRKGKRKEEVKKKEPEKVEEPKVAVYEPFKCGICDHSTETLGK
jgi:hypothetical protein